ncbi:MAG: serine/threonine-protein kinase, partial [Acidobacteriota bacterium]
MTPARWQQIDRLLDEALDLPAEDRAAFLTQACHDDEDLRQQVEQILAGQEGADAIFENSPGSAMAEVFRGQTITALGGQKIGPYQILNEIGRGGMGVVYRAVRADDEYRQEVAIKLVWPGPQNTELLRRFRRERQILANLDHPHIARLLDGGRTEQGWPYLVMEYIEGVPITQYCQQQALPLRDRLALFRDVCSAVQYAHQNLIIHRDLKPGNILVTDVGEAKLPKLLDFGIAKLLDPQRHHITAHSTQAGLQLMTPEYASPEQMRAEPITTASDVYSLGVLLYELLTGQSPYRFKNHTLP